MSRITPLIPVLALVQLLLSSPQVANAQERYQGTATGNLFVDIPAADGTEQRLYIVGIKVELLRKASGLAADESLAEGFTEEGGAFELGFNPNIAASNNSIGVFNPATGSWSYSPLTSGPYDIDSATIGCASYTLLP